MLQPGELTINKSEAPDLACRDLEDQSAELIKAGRASFASDAIASSRADESASMNQYTCFSKCSAAVSRGSAGSEQPTEKGKAPQQVRSHAKPAMQLTKQLAGILATAFGSS